MDTITDILARPDEAARQLSEMRAALEEVTAQLAAVTAERDAAIDLCNARVVDRDIQLRRAERLQAERNEWRCVCLAMDKHDQKRAAAARKVAQWVRDSEKDAAARYESCQNDFLKAIRQRDAARAEVARLRAALAQVPTFIRDGFVDEALRVDTAPATGRE